MRPAASESSRVVAPSSLEEAEAILEHNLRPFVEGAEALLRTEFPTRDLAPTEICLRYLKGR